MTRRRATNSRQVTITLAMPPLMVELAERAAIGMSRSSLIRLAIYHELVAQGVGEAHEMAQLSDAMDSVDANWSRIRRRGPLVRDSRDGGRE